MELYVKFGRIDNVRTGHSEEQEFKILTDGIVRGRNQAREWANEKYGVWQELEYKVLE